MTEKLAKAYSIIWRAIMDSEYLEDLQNAKHQDDFESVISDMASEILDALTENGLHTISKKDALIERREQVLKNIELNKTQLIVLAREIGEYE